jgi:hypothetical protein
MDKIIQINEEPANDFPFEVEPLNIINKIMKIPKSIELKNNPLDASLM